ncbi:hypothetical protein CEE35_06520 [Candidatus Aerophobetes bacterium Ae_b3b]|nr:MAG: hypothetical protein CEE35_06520 [Candidatus Aerophobetes bacterium Ae_b3b]
MTSRERVLTALNLKKPDRVPFLDAYIDPNIQRALLRTERLSVPTISETTPGWESWGSFERQDNKFKLRLAYSISPEFVEKFGLDGFGIDFLPPLFVKVKYGKQGREFIADGLLTSDKALKLVTLPDPADESLYEPARKILERYGNEYAVHGRIRLGVSPALLSMGIEGFSYVLQDNPALIEKVLDIYTDWSAELVKHLSKLGFAFLWAFDDIAYNSGPMFSPSVFREIFLPQMKKVANGIRIPWVYHSDGNLTPLLDDLLTLEMNGLHPIQPDVMDIVELKKDYGNKICLLGNIDVGLLAKGIPEEVEKEVKEKIETLAADGGYILTSGNSIPSYCKPENVIAVIRAVHKYG